MCSVKAENNFHIISQDTLTNIVHNTQRTQQGIA